MMDKTKEEIIRGTPLPESKIIYQFQWKGGMYLPHIWHDIGNQELLAAVKADPAQYQLRAVVPVDVLLRAPVATVASVRADLVEAGCAQREATAATSQAVPSELAKLNGFLAAELAPDVGVYKAADVQALFASQSKTPQYDELTQHLRQFQHNDGSGFVFGYDKSGVDRMMARLLHAKPVAWRTSGEFGSEYSTLYDAIPTDALPATPLYASPVASQSKGEPAAAALRKLCDQLEGAKRFKHVATGTSQTLSYLEYEDVSCFVEEARKSLAAPLAEAVPASDVERDAARYRWLCQHGHDTMPDAAREAFEVACSSGQAPSKAAIDASIDEQIGLAPAEPAPILPSAEQAKRTAYQKVLDMPDGPELVGPAAHACRLCGSMMGETHALNCLHGGGMVAYNHCTMQSQRAEAARLSAPILSGGLTEAALNLRALAKSGRELRQEGWGYNLLPHDIAELERVADLLARLSTPGGQAPSRDPDADYFTPEQVRDIASSIKPGDGWSGDDWDFALVNAAARRIGQSPAQVTGEPASIDTPEFRALLGALLQADRKRVSGGFTGGREEYAKAMAELISHIATHAQAPAERDATDDENVNAAREQFVAYVAKNYPAGTVIGDPKWHAPRLFTAAFRALFKVGPSHPSASPDAQEGGSK